MSAKDERRSSECRGHAEKRRVSRTRGGAAPIEDERRSGACRHEGECRGRGVERRVSGTTGEAAKVEDKRMSGAS